MPKAYYTIRRAYQYDHPDKYMSSAFGVVWLYADARGVLVSLKNDLQYWFAGKEVVLRNRLPRTEAVLSNKLERIIERHNNHLKRVNP
jgi:hypothetical protein